MHRSLNRKYYWCILVSCPSTIFTARIRTMGKVIVSVCLSVLPLVLCPFQGVWGGGVAGVTSFQLLTLSPKMTKTQIPFVNEGEGKGRGGGGGEGMQLGGGMESGEGRGP